MSVKPAEISMKKIDGTCC